jgi:putative addiction module CopG family antidote
MNLTLQPELVRLIEKQVAAGRFSSPEEVVAAALQALEQAEEFGDFQAGELNDLLNEGEQSIQQDGTLDGDEAFRERQRRRQQRSGSRP